MLHCLHVSLFILAVRKLHLHGLFVFFFEFVID